MNIGCVDNKIFDELSNIKYLRNILSIFMFAKRSSEVPFTVCLFDINEIIYYNI